MSAEIKPVGDYEKFINQMVADVETMTQGQINACAFCMGGGGAVWSKERLVKELLADLERKTKAPTYIEVMG